ncbi:MAG TPA: copper-binding protein [Terriglobales bacterium]|nr:copper-binding protein [Terriglobales bacterium]
MNCELTFGRKGRAMQSPLLSRFFSRRVFFLSLAALLMPALFSAGCQKKTEKRYPVQGTVIAIHADQGILEIDEDAVPGYMAAMEMSYVVANPAELRGLRPGDLVKAELVLANGNATLESVKLVRKAPPEAPPPSSPAAKKE